MYRYDSEQYNYDMHIYEVYMELRAWFDYKYLISWYCCYMYLLWTSFEKLLKLASP